MRSLADDMLSPSVSAMTPEGVVWDLVLLVVGLLVGGVIGAVLGYVYAVIKQAPRLVQPWVTSAPTASGGTSAVRAINPPNFIGIRTKRRYRRGYLPEPRRRWYDFSRGHNYDRATAVSVGARILDAKTKEPVSGAFVKVQLGDSQWEGGVDVPSGVWVIARLFEWDSPMEYGIRTWDEVTLDPTWSEPRRFIVEMMDRNHNVLVKQRVSVVRSAKHGWEVKAS